jgi:hypothetical protein
MTYAQPTPASPLPSPPPSSAAETAAERKARAARVLERAKDALIIRKVWLTGSDVEQERP